MTIRLMELGAFSGAIMAIAGLAAFIGRPLQKISKRLTDNDKGTLAVLRYDIVMAYDAAKRDGEISECTLAAVNELYERYKELKGNGYIDEVIKRVNAMKVKL